MNKQYHQVFVSSTYEDLREERQEVMQALLELDCIPSGMELFPAASEDQWSLIKRVIDDCDYYLVIVGGRYGSLGTEGKSYTQMEYEYAVEKNKPVIAFLHADPSIITAGKTEEHEDNKKRLRDFREMLRKRPVKSWASAKELGSVVSRSIVALRQSRPSPGWVRADALIQELAAPEILKLKNRIEELEEKLQESRHQPPRGSEGLAQGDEQFQIQFRANFVDFSGEGVYQRVFVNRSWNSIASVLLPLMIDRAEETTLRAKLMEFCRAAVLEDVEGSTDDIDSVGISLNSDSFQTIIIQLRALGMITRDKRQTSIRDTRTFWTLTEFGDELITTLRAVSASRKAEPAPPAL